jgi:hypothetical protein
MAQNHMAPIGIWRLQLSMMRDLHDCYRRRNMVWSGNDGDRIGETSAVATRRADTSPAQYEPPQVPQSSNPGQNTEYLQGCSKLFFGWFSFPLFFCIYLVSTPNFGTNLDLWCKKKIQHIFLGELRVYSDTSRQHWSWDMGQKKAHTPPVLRSVFRIAEELVQSLRRVK